MFVRKSTSVFWINYLNIVESFFTQAGYPEIAVSRRNIDHSATHTNFDVDQNTAAINQTTYRERLVDRFDCLTTSVLWYTSCYVNKVLFRFLFINHAFCFNLSIRIFVSVIKGYDFNNHGNKCITPG